MVNYTPQFKNSILREYVAGSRGHGFLALAKRYNIRGGPMLVRRWYSQWNGTAASMERAQGSGRRAILTPTQVQRYIVRPIRRHNRSHTAIEYPELKEGIEQKTGQSISVRTIQRYGREEGGVSSGTTVARTENERMLHNHIGIEGTLSLGDAPTHQF